MERLSADDPHSIGGFRLLGRLGEGGMGRVYLARSARGRTVAVKVVKSELARQSAFRRRFAQEITAARRVGEKWTAPVLEADTEAETPWVATGYIAGPSLSEVIDEQYGPLPAESVSALASGLVRALHDIHSAGLVHRDLKPSNILVTIDGPRVIDFGIARALDSAMQSGGGLTSTGALVGSPGFMSPEQVRGQRVTPASDVFCLGAVLAYAATGRMPFGTLESGVHALLFRIASEEPDLTGLSGELHDLVAGCLVKDPELRPGVDELIKRTECELAGAWLPGEVLAQLGRHAVRLLDSEDPETDGAGIPRQATVAEPPPAPAADEPASRPAAPAPAANQGPHGALTQTATPPGAFGPAGVAGGYGPPAGGPYSPPPGLHPAPGWPQQAPGAYGPAGGTPVPGPGTPPPSSGRPLPTAKPLRKAAVLIYVLMSLLLVVTVIDIMVHMTVGTALSSRTDVFLTNGVPGYSALANATLAVEVLDALIFFPLAVMWAVWFWRARVNAGLLAPGRVRYPSATAAAAWFIPVVNLFAPKQIMNDVWSASTASGQWHGSAAGEKPGRGLVNCWWVLWLGYLFLEFATGIESWYDVTERSEATDVVVLAFVSDTVAIVSGIVALVLVHRLSNRQDAALSGQG